MEIVKGLVVLVMPFDKLAIKLASSAVTATIRLSVIRPKGLVSRWNAGCSSDQLAVCRIPHTIVVNHISAVMKQCPAGHLLYVTVHLIASNIVVDSVHLGYHLSLTAMLLLSMLHRFAIASAEEHNKRQLFSANDRRFGFF